MTTQVCHQPDIKEKAVSIAAMTILTPVVVGIVISYIFYVIKKQNVAVGSKIQPINGSLENFLGFFGRLEKYVDTSFSQLGMVLGAILIAGVISSFNGNVMTPIIYSMLPPNSLKQGVELGRGVQFYPGFFLLSIISFIGSLFIAFFAIETMRSISSVPSLKMTLNVILSLIIIGGIIFLIGWNAVYISQPVCTQPTSQLSQQASYQYNERLFKPTNVFG